MDRLMPHRLSSRCIVAAALALSATPALALDLPGRKPGLWELTMSFEGRGLPPQKTQQCMDEETDKLLNATGTAMQKDACPTQNVQRRGGALVVDSVCDFGNGKTTTHSVLTGDFNNAYTVKVESKHEGGPRVPGMPADGTSRMTIAAKWLGPCKPGQKPGDIIMPNGMTMNIRNMPGVPGLPKR